jgi:hypothetical protein
MTLLKKPLVIAVLVAVLVSPLLPSAFADSGAWNNSIAEAAWDYDNYKVQRLSNDESAGPYKFAGVVFTTKTSESCEYADNCDLVDLTILSNGQELVVEGVDDRLTQAFWHTAQDDRFIYFVPFEDTTDSWGAVHEYDPATGSIAELANLEREDNEIAFVTIATDGDRIYSSTLQEDEVTGDVETAVSVYDYGSEYERDEFTYSLTAPWQEIVDVYEGLALVRFQFEGDFEQLWIVNQTERWMEEVPDTWTEPGAALIGSHFMSDGTIQYFRNYRLFTYDWENDEQPSDAGGAYLSWLVEPDEAIQINAERMAYIDDENGLYVSSISGVSKFGVAQDGVFNLESDAIYFQNDNGEYVGYMFETGAWVTRNYHVTDSYDDILIGIDENTNIWYENTTNGYLLNIGYGATPLLTDREHAYWLGSDGNLYNVTFSALLDLERPAVEAFMSYTEKAVYLVKGDQIWLVPDETTYFTWFDSWNDVLKVSQATIEVYVEALDYEGKLKFAPGTRVKAVSSPRVYVVGSEGQLHWITSETVADEIYGSDWNQDIVEVNDTYLYQYSKGSEVGSGNDVRSI